MTQGSGMVVIGAGDCGTRAALTMREAGYRGPVTLIGSERHLPYERPPLSKEVLAGDRPKLKAIATGEGLAEADITYLPLASALSIDRAVRSVGLADGRHLGYDRLLIATGASPRALPSAADSKRCVYLRTFDDALAIRSHLDAGIRLAVIGGGFIGLEVAAAAVTAGCDVTVIEAQPRILMRGVPEEIAAIVHAEHVCRGTRIVVGQAVDAVADGPDGVGITLSGGERVDADVCLVGIGAVPNTALAASAGLALDNGVAVDAWLQTSDPDIFAAGDCCSFPLPLYGGRRVRLESWRNALEQGIAAARNMLGAGEPQAAVPWFWSDQFDLGLQIAGLPDEAVECVSRDPGDGSLFQFGLDAEGRLVSASGIGRGNAVAKEIRLSEMLIARRAHPPRERLASPDFRLKALLAA